MGKIVFDMDFLGRIVENEKGGRSREMPLAKLLSRSRPRESYSAANNPSILIKGSSFLSGKSTAKLRAE